jgi:uncharacterized protein (TIGR02391 family)
MNKNLKIFERIVRRSTELPTLDGDINREDSIETHPFDQRNIHPKIARSVRKLFDDGHFSHATFEAFKILDIEVRNVSKINESGEKLMLKAFNENSPSIRLTQLNTTSEVDEQRGYKFFFSGSLVAIRNPRGHDLKLDTIDLCLDHLSVASALLRRLENRHLP